MQFGKLIGGLPPGAPVEPYLGELMAAFSLPCEVCGVRCSSLISLPQFDIDETPDNVGVVCAVDGSARNRHFWIDGSFTRICAKCVRGKIARRPLTEEREASQAPVA